MTRRPLRAYWKCFSFLTATQSLLPILLKANSYFLPPHVHKGPLCYVWCKNRHPPTSRRGNKTKKIKRAKRSEINFLPDVPQGQTPNSLEDERKTLIEEIQKVRKDWKMIDALMGSTFALRRKEIVDDEPPVSEVAERWPALLSERQVIFTMW